MKNVGRRVLIVDDEQDICSILAHLMEKEGLYPLVAFNGEEALETVRLREPDVILADIRMPGMNGMEVLERVKKLAPELPVVMITAHAEVSGAVKALKAGAHDYLAKPFDHHEVLRVIRRALAEREINLGLRHLPSQPEERLSLSKLMGPSDVVTRLASEVNTVAKSTFSVVIQGDTGTGKELVARAIHQASPRGASPFVPVDCGAIPENLFENELFGHEKGAFTSAGSMKPGKLDLAQGGTLFLDEISNMPLASQAKLLRVLQEGKFYRVGGASLVNIDVRLVVASNQNLLDAVEAGTFRQDLLYRLNEFTIQLPSLRERKEDIVYLAKRFMDITNVELNKNVTGMSRSAIKALLVYPWPGNVRQLRSVIRRAVLLADQVIREKHFDFGEQGTPFRQPEQASLAEGVLPDCSLKEIVHRKVQAVEREVVLEALQHTGGNKAKAARMLKIDYKTLYNKIKQLDISFEGGSYA
jgi:two-component system nitrogen regulation response regulator GlnG